MGMAIVVHIDEIPYLAGGPSETGESRTFGYQSIGDRESKPWVFVHTNQAGREAPPHTHAQDEVLHILEGSLIFEGRSHGPGTVLYIERDTEYGFEAGPEGVRFLNVRSGPDKPGFISQ